MVDRYDEEERRFAGGTYTAMALDNHGDWARYDDYQALENELAECKAEVARLREHLYTVVSFGFELLDSPAMMAASITSPRIKKRAAGLLTVCNDAKQALEEGEK